VQELSVYLALLMVTGAYFDAVVQSLCILLELGQGTLTVPSSVR